MLKQIELENWRKEEIQDGRVRFKLQKTFLEDIIKNVPLDKARVLKQLKDIFSRRNDIIKDEIDCLHSFNLIDEIVYNQIDSLDLEELEYVISILSIFLENQNFVNSNKTKIRNLFFNCFRLVAKKDGGNTSFCDYSPE